MTTYSDCDYDDESSAQNPHKWTGPHPADRDIGALRPYYECDYCGACSSAPSEHNPECPA